MPNTTAVIRRRAAAAMVLAIAVLAVVTLAMHHPQAASLEAQTSTTDGTGSSQTGSSGTVTVSTTRNLVQGSVRASSTTTTVAASVKGPDTSSKTTRTTNWKVWGIVAGLVLVALAMALLTWRYWRKTRPAGSPALERGAELTVGGGNPDDADGGGARDGGKAGAGADDTVVVPGEPARHDNADEREARRQAQEGDERDKGTTEGDGGSVAGPRRGRDTSTRGAKARAAAIRLAAAARGDRDTSDDTMPQRVTRVRAKPVDAGDGSDDRTEGREDANDPAETDEGGEVAPLRLFRGRRRESRYANVEISLPQHQRDDDRES